MFSIFIHSSGRIHSGGNINIQFLAFAFVLLLQPTLTILSLSCFQVVFFVPSFCVHCELLALLALFRQFLFFSHPILCLYISFFSIKSLICCTFILDFELHFLIPRSVVSLLVLSFSVYLYVISIYPSFSLTCCTKGGCVSFSLFNFLYEMQLS